MRKSVKTIIEQARHVMWQSMNLGLRQAVKAYDLEEEKKRQKKEHIKQLATRGEVE